MARKKPKTTTRVLEEHYFHSGNSGMTWRVLEKTTTYSNGHTNTEHRFESVHSAFGAYSTSSFPLGSKAMVKSLIEALQRTHDLFMPAPEEYGHPTFEDRPAKTREVVGSLRVERAYGPETVTSIWSTSEKFLGLNYFHPETDELVQFLSAKEAGVEDDSMDRGGGCSSTSDDKGTYFTEEIGMTLAAVKLRRQKLGIYQPSESSKILRPAPAKPVI